MASTTGNKVALVAGTAEDLEAARSRLIANKGRPSTFTPETAAEILVSLEAGDSLTSICKRTGMPHIATIYDWKRSVPHFGEAYARAMRGAASSYAHSGVDLLDDLETPKFDEGGNPIPLSMTTIRLAEMRAKYRKELAKDYDRDQFGDSRRIDQRIQVEHTVGGIIEQLTEGLQPLVIEGEYDII